MVTGEENWRVSIASTGLGFRWGLGHGHLSENGLPHGDGAVSGIKFDGAVARARRASDKLNLVAMILPHINTIGSTRI